jgi:hypothetical protein
MRLEMVCPIPTNALHASNHKVTGYSVRCGNMSDSEKPDLKSGAPIASILDHGKQLGVVDREEVLLVRRGTQFFAVGAYCTHYHVAATDRCGGGYPMVAENVMTRRDVEVANRHLYIQREDRIVGR